MRQYGLKLGASATTDYQWGKLPKVIINPSGDNTPYLPVYEPQLLPSGEDEHGCHIWGTLNAIETNLKITTGQSFNFAERPVYIGTNSDQSGGDPFQTGLWIKDNGLVDESVMPMTQTLAEYVQPKPLPQYITDRMKLFLEKYYIYQEYVWNDFDYPITISEKLRRLRQALTMGAVGLSVPAWFQRGDGLYHRPSGMQDNHWCVCAKVNDNHLVVFDSYDQSIKKVDLDINSAVCIRYVINSYPLQKQSLWAKIIAWLKKFYKL